MHSKWAALSCLILGMGCGPSTSSSTLKVGAITSLTGGYGSVERLQGIQLAVEEINAAGGVLGSQSSWSATTTTPTPRRPRTWRRTWSPPLKCRSSSEPPPAARLWPRARSPSPITCSWFRAPPPPRSSPSWTVGATSAAPARPTVCRASCWRSGPSGGSADPGHRAWHRRLGAQHDPDCGERVQGAGSNVHG